MSEPAPQPVGSDRTNGCRGGYWLLGEAIKPVAIHRQIASGQKAVDSPCNGRMVYTHPHGSNFVSDILFAHRLACHDQILDDGHIAIVHRGGCREVAFRLLPFLLVAGNRSDVHQAMQALLSMNQVIGQSREIGYLLDGDRHALGLKGLDSYQDVLLPLFHYFSLIVHVRSPVLVMDKCC